LTTAKKTNVTDDLRKQLSDIEDHQAALITERDEISYLALVDRDKKSIERLNSINDELRNQTTRAETVQAALKGAIRRETAARHDEARKADRLKAKSLRDELLPQLTDHCEKLDEALATLVAHIDGATEVVRKINAAGAGPLERLFLLNGVKVVKAAMWRTPWRQEFRPIPPNERHVFKELLDAKWAVAIRRRADELDGAAVTQTAAKAA
jgi:dGTP triphosphohydrolase